MPTLFQTKPGSVVKLEDGALQCSTQLLDLDPRITFETERSIVTRLTMSQKANVQFLHTLGSLIYIYVFGDRIGTIGLSGLSFACECPSGEELGAVKMYQWYKRHRASRRRAPVRVMLGREVIEGFITDFTGDVVDPSLNLFQWGVNLMTLPEDETPAPRMPLAA
jgi:hypothetical protein